MKRRFKQTCALSLGLLMGFGQMMPATLLANEAVMELDEVQEEQTLYNIAPKATLVPDSELSSASNLVDGDYTSLWIADNNSVPNGVNFRWSQEHEISSIHTWFEIQQDTTQIVQYEISYKDETGEFNVVHNSQNLQSDGSFDEEVTFTNPIVTSEIRVAITGKADGTTIWPAMAEVEIYSETQEETPVEETNLALKKTVTADVGNPARITDGIKTNYWDGGEAPSEFVIDLGTGCYISRMHAWTYYGDGRYYHYDIYTSLDGRSYTKVASKSDDSTSTSEGNEFAFDEQINARYVRVVMTYNSANPSVHMNEFEVYGYEDPSYVDPGSVDIPVNDPDNIAKGKPVRTGLNHEENVLVNDGLLNTQWDADYFPSYVDIDLMEEHDLEEAILYFPVKEDRYYWYTIYGSNDYSNWDRIYVKHDNTVHTDEGELCDLSGNTYRFVRVYVENVYNANKAVLSEVVLHGKPTGENTSTTLRDGSIDDLLGIQDFDETEYAAPITEAETIENVYGIIDRTVGKQYRDWFDFELKETAENGYDFYEVSMKDGKVHIAGNDGISLASGLNHYYKYYCNVCISEQENQTKMPESIVEVEGVIRKETPYKVRYAMNYCTLDYTFAFFGKDEWQKENDYLALSGVNVVLDLAGQEAAWIKFLQNFGYSVDDAKDWLAGPSYYAWQFMDNLENFGGPVSDGWVVDRLEMARENQRWKRSLGMETVMQGYAGMVPTNFSEFQPDVEILKQGAWCGLTRPDMIRTDGELYDEYAAKFYEAQRWALGDTSNYYAADPFHEGGIRPSDLSDATIAAEVLDSLLKYDEDAVWMVQAWWSNPTNSLLEGMGDYRQDHVMILDLTAMTDPKWNSTSYGSTTLDAEEFNGTDWVWCMLKNYGGNPSMDGKLQQMADDIPAAFANSEHMKGIGFISEATYDNPVVYELLFEAAWSEEAIDVEKWLDDYVVRRYGAESESARTAWNYLLKSVYNKTGNNGNIFATTPANLSNRSISYRKGYLQKALNLLLEDYDTLSESKAYLYDLTELMRQQVSDYACLKWNDVRAALDAGDLEAFQKAKAEFLNAFDVCDAVEATQKDTMIGEWIGRAEDWAENYDDFSMDTLPMNAKALLTTWACKSTASSIPDYAYRHYSGLMEDIYKARWSDYLDYREDLLLGKDVAYSYNKFEDYWNWIINTPEYSRTPNNDPAEMKKICQRVVDECFYDDEVVIPDTEENKGNLCLLKPTTASKENNSGGSNGGYADYTVDGSTSSYWDGGDWADKPWLIVDLEKTYTLDRLNVVNYVTSGRYYQFELYVSTDKTNWTKVAAQDTTTPCPASGYDFEMPSGTNARYIKLVGLYQNHNEGFHVSELRAYGSDLIAPLKALIAQAEALETRGWSEADKTELAAAIENAKAIVAKADASKEELEEATEALEAAMDKLPVPVNKTLLEQAIIYANSDEVQEALKKVHPTVKTAFETRLAHAVEVFNDENALQEDVDKAWIDLVEVIQMLDFTADKASLESLVESAKALEAEDYVQDEAWTRFQEALSHAQEVLDSETALQDSIDEAYEALLAAMNSLNHVVVLNTDLLQWLYDSVKDTDLNLYAAGDEIAAFQASLANAKAVLDDPQSQEQIDEAVKDLNEKWLSLRLRPDEELLKALQSILDQAGRLNASAYSLKSWNALQDVCAKIEAALSDDTLDAIQAQKLLEKGQKALESLEPAETTADSISASVSESTEPAKASVKSESVKTSVMTGTSLFAAGAAASVGLLLKRRKNKR